MPKQKPEADAGTPALLSKTLRFLAAGGLALSVAIIQEVAQPDRDWLQLAAMTVSLIVGLGGGVYGRVVARGPIIFRSRF